MKRNFDCQFLYSDTDSLLYEIKSDDLYREHSEKRNILIDLDLSIYPKNHPLYDPKRIWSF